MFVVFLLILLVALVVTPFSPTQSARGTSKNTEIKEHRKNTGVAGLITQAQSRDTKAKTKRKLRAAKLPKREERKADLGLVVSEVATRLRSGASPEEAWYQSLKSSYGNTSVAGIDDNGVPHALRALWKRPRRFLQRKKSADQTQLAIPAAIAVCRLSHSSGAPIADVLDSCASGISEAAEAASARRVALAGPQTSAQMLAWLPLVGVVLGSALGAEPLHFLFSTTPGLCVFFLGLACEIAGIAWVRRLSARAENI